MGHSVRIVLPPATQVEDVADVIGKLAGLKAARLDIGNGHWSASVPGVEVASSQVIGLVDITIRLSATLQRHAFYHFEFEGGNRGMMPPSTPFWVAIGTRLVQIFGGSIVYDDSNTNKPDLIVDPPPGLYAVDDDDESWTRRQQLIMDIPALTKAELKAAKKFASGD